MTDQTNHPSQDTTDISNKPLSQLALMYQAIEAVLRRGEWLTVAQIRQKPGIGKIENNPWQAKSIIKTLMHHDCIEEKGAGRNRAFRWKQDAPPFVLSLKMANKGMREASIAVTTTPAATPAKPLPMRTMFNPDGTPRQIDSEIDTRAKVLPGAPQIPQKPLELVVNGLIILVDQNPVTGNDRIVIERIWQPK